MTGQGVRMAAAGAARLTRLPLSLMNGTAALGGYLLFPSKAETTTAAAIFAGVTLFAAAASALNQLLEKDLDALMRRTSDRPLPKGQLTKATAVLAGVACALAGFLLLFSAGGTIPAALGAVTLLWYLAVYTPLKRASSLALLAGAICGCAGPVIGWSAAGGAIGDFRIVLLAGIFYLWQVPHFWLLQKRHADDYRRAGLPVFAPAGGEGLLPFQLLWIGAMVCATLMLPAFGVITTKPLLWTLVFVLPLVATPFRRLEPALFTGVNLFPALVTLALVAGR